MITLVPVADGVELEARTYGSGEPLLLIQTALDADALVPLSQEQKFRDFRVIDCRRRGYGKSTPLDGPGSVRRDAADCLAVLEALDATPAHVLGTSYSAAVALELAARAPGVVRTLTLIEPPPAHGPPAEEFLQVNRRLQAIFSADGVTAALDDFTRVVGAPSWLEEREHADAELVDRIERDATTFFVADVPALLGWQFERSRAATVMCPILYVGGSDSLEWFRHVHDWVKNLFPHCEDHLVVGAGHSVASTHSHHVSALVVDFLGRSDG